MLYEFVAAGLMAQGGRDHETHKSEHHQAKGTNGFMVV